MRSNYERTWVGADAARPHPDGRTPAACAGFGESGPPLAGPCKSRPRTGRGHGNGGSLVSTVALAPKHAALDLIDVGENTRELDKEHVEALANSIALRGLIVPL